MRFFLFKFTYFIGVYELGIGYGIGYLFSQVLKATNFIEFRPIQLMVGGIMIIMFFTSQFTQYQLIISENNISDLSFFEFMKIRIENGLTIKGLNTGWIGLEIFQIVFPYFLAIGKVGISSAKSIIEKIPDKVLEYTIYLFEMEKSVSEVRAELASKRVE